MMMMSNQNNYASYKYFDDWLAIYGDSLNIQNPFWMGSILPSQSVSINAAGNNLLFLSGGINAWNTDTTSGNWLGFTGINPLVLNGSHYFEQLDSTQRIGLFYNALGTNLYSISDIALLNSQVQQGLLSPDTYLAEFNESGVLNYVPASKYALPSGSFGQSYYYDDIDSTAKLSYNFVNNIYSQKFTEESSFFGDRMWVFDQGNWLSYFQHGGQIFNFVNAENAKANQTRFRVGSARLVDTALVSVQEGDWQGSGETPTGISIALAGSVEDAPTFSRGLRDIVWLRTGLADSVTTKHIWSDFFIGQRLRGGTSIQNIISSDWQTRRIALDQYTSSEENVETDRFTGIDDNGVIEPMSFEQKFAIAAFSYPSDFQLSSDTIQAVPIFNKADVITGGTDFYEATSDTTLSIKQNGTYTIDCSLYGQSVSADNSVSYEIQLDATAIHSAPNAIIFDVSNGATIGGINSVFTVDSAPQTIKLVFDNGTLSGSVFFNAGSMCRIKRVY